MAMPIKLLAIGDMHLGRQPRRLPAELSNQTRTLSPQKGWERTVEQAVKSHVDLVVLAGDLVDQEDNFFEAFRPLETGINTLVEAGIEVVGISGNHDVSVLPRLAKQLSQFKLLGANGQWETHHFEKNGQTVTVHGWSYPKPVVNESPLEGHTFKRTPGLNFGLLHCDRDQVDSRYAPVNSQALKQAGLDGWLLGHVHKPDPLAADSINGYLGSITGLHVGEHGPRGPWLLNIEQGKVQSVHQWTLAPLVWIHVTLDVSGMSQVEDVMDRLLQEIRYLDQQASTYLKPPHALGIRVILEGSSDQGAVFVDALSEKQNTNMAVGDIPTIFIESVQDQTTTAIDLNLLAQRTDHIGRLARSLALLDETSEKPERVSEEAEQRRALIDAASEQLISIADAGRWKQALASSLTETEVVMHLKQSGNQLLREWLAQTEEWTS